MIPEEKKEWDAFNYKILAFLMFLWGFFFGIVFSWIILK